jgi:hypothetical protein
MRTEKFQLYGNNLVCAGAFQLLRDHASAQIRGHVGFNIIVSPKTLYFNTSWYMWKKRDKICQDIISKAWCKNSETLALHGG